MNILQSWKQSLSLFAPANFGQFIKDVGKSTGALLVSLASCWYVWIIPLIGLSFGDAIATYCVSLLATIVQPSMNPFTFILLKHFLVTHGLLNFLLGLLSLWLFAIVYENDLFVIEPYNARQTDIKRRIFKKYAPMMGLIYAVWSVVSMMGHMVPLYIYPIYIYAAQVLLYAFSFPEYMYFSVLYARFLAYADISVWMGLKWTIRDMFYMLPTLFLMGFIVHLVIDRVLPFIVIYIIDLIHIDAFYINVIFTLLCYFILPCLINFWLNFYEWQFKRQSELYMD